MRADNTAPSAALSAVPVPVRCSAVQRGAVPAGRCRSGHFDWLHLSLDRPLTRQSRPLTGGRPYRPLGVRWGKEGRTVPAVSDVKQLKPCTSTPPRAVAHPMAPEDDDGASPREDILRTCQRARLARLS